MTAPTLRDRFRPKPRPRLRQELTRVWQGRRLVYVGIQLLLVLLGTIVVQLGGVLFTSIGTSVIATGLCGIVALGWVIYSESESYFRRQIDAYGLVAAFPERSLPIKEEYINRLSRPKGGVDIMGFGLNHLREELEGDFARWAAFGPVRILLVDLDTGYADQRDVEERNVPGKIRSEVKLFLEKTQELSQNPSVTFEVKLDKTLPSVNYFRIGKEAFWGPYLISEEGQPTTSRSLPTQIVRSPGYMYDRLQEHFNAIWDEEKFSVDPWTTPKQ